MDFRNVHVTSFRTHTHTYTHKYTHSHKYTHTHTHIYIYILLSSNPSRQHSGCYIGGGGEVGEKEILENNEVEGRRK